MTESERRVARFLKALGKAEREFERWRDATYGEFCALVSTAARGALIECRRESKRVSRPSWLPYPGQLDHEIELMRGLVNDAACDVCERAKENKP
jgi:hypothetical protein